MLDASEKQLVVQLFGLNAFRTGLHRFLDPTTNTFDSGFGVKFLWAAKVYYFSRPVIVAVIHLEAGFKGFLFDTREEVDKNSIVVELPGWTDPVVDALRCVNLAPYEYGQVADYSMVISVATEITQSEIHIDMDGQEPTADALSQAVLVVIEKIAELYNTKQWQRFLQTRWDHETF